MCDPTKACRIISYLVAIVVTLSPSLKRIQPPKRPAPIPWPDLPSPWRRGLLITVLPNRCSKHFKQHHFDPTPLTRYTPWVGAWRSLVARVLWEH